MINKNDHYIIFYLKMDDCFSVILTFFDVQTLITCFLVNKKFYALSQQDCLWQPHLKDTWFPCQKNIYNHYRDSVQCQQFIGCQFFQFIESLNLSHRHISELPSALNVLKNLKRIDLSHNDITTLPAAWSVLPLQKIYLSHNHITSLPAAWSVMPLQTIHLSDNHITTLPTEWSVMPLEIIDLSDNDITSLPPEWSVMPLKIIFLNHNQITTLPAEWEHFRHVYI